MGNIYWGVNGQQYQDFEEAWSAYHEAHYGDVPVDSEKYHTERLAFMCGAISAINVLSVRINGLAGKMPMQEQVPTAIMTTLNECLNLANEEQNRK